VVCSSLVLLEEVLVVLKAFRVILVIVLGAVPFESDKVLALALY
jgi:hypothetical protein